MACALPWQCTMYTRGRAAFKPELSCINIALTHPAVCIPAMMAKEKHFSILQAYLSKCCAATWCRKCVLLEGSRSRSIDVIAFTSSEPPTSLTDCECNLALPSQRLLVLITKIAQQNHIAGGQCFLLCSLSAQNAVRAPSTNS